MTFELSNLVISENEHVELAMVSDLHRLEGRDWRFEL